MKKYNFMAAIFAVFFVSAGFAKNCDNRESIDKMLPEQTTIFVDDSLKSEEYLYCLFQVGQVSASEPRYGRFVKLISNPGMSVQPYAIYELESTTGNLVFKIKNSKEGFRLAVVRDSWDPRTAPVSIGSLKYNLGSRFVLNAVCKD